MQYNSDKTFQIWMYTVSHAMLILRSFNKGHEEEKDYSIDIEFWGVIYLELAAIFEEINIQKIEENVPERFKEYRNKSGCKIFELRSKQSIYYIIASGCRVGKHTWQNENRILNPYLEYEEIIASM